MANNDNKLLRHAIWGLAFSILILGVIEIYTFYDVTKELSDSFTEVGNDQSTRLKELYQTANYEELTSVSQARIKTHPNDDYPHYYLGLMYYQLNDYKNSRLHLKKAVSLDPSWSASVNEYLESMHRSD